MILDRMDVAWINVITAGILLGQGMIIRVISSYPIQGLYAIQPSVAFALSCVVGALISSFTLSGGIREAFLFVHAVLGILFNYSILSVVVCILWVTGEPLVPKDAQASSFLLIISVLLGISFSLELALSWEDSGHLLSKIVLLGLILHSVIRLINRYDRYVQVVRTGDACTNTESSCIHLGIQSTEYIEIEEPSDQETPKASTPPLSPQAETTPSDLSLHWFPESTTDLETDELDTWYYIDLRGVVRGPFDAERMRRWYLSGFLKEDLLVSNRPDKPFIAIKIRKEKSDIFTTPFA
jgi:hypothetical protein